MKGTKARMIIYQVLLGDYHLNCRTPLTSLNNDILFLHSWNPEKEITQQEKSIALKRLNEFKRDLMLGGATK